MPVKTIPIKKNTSTSAPIYSKEEIDQAFQQCKTLMAEGSKNIFLISCRFDRKTREAAFAIYGWFQFCHDVIVDEKSNQKLKDLVQLTNDCYAGKKMESLVYVAFQNVTHQYQIPIDYPLEVLEGLAMEGRNETYENINQLLVYCYRVAGTVGLMMSHVMGISNEKALLHAASLGKAIQLTNLSRDVGADAARGRVYLPQDWMEEVGLDKASLTNPDSHEKTAIVVKRVLLIADILYQSGNKALAYLPFRSACAIASAKEVHAEIGRHLLRSSDKVWKKRILISSGRKFWLMILGLAKVVKFLPKRLFNPWRPVPIKTIWRNI